MGPSMLPWGIPLLTRNHLENFPLNPTHCFLLHRKFSIHFNKTSVIPYHFNLFSKCWCETLSNAFSKSVYITSTWEPWSVCVVHRLVKRQTGKPVNRFQTGNQFWKRTTGYRIFVSNLGRLMTSGSDFKGSSHRLSQSKWSTSGCVKPQ